MDAAFYLVTQAVLRDFLPLIAFACGWIARAIVMEFARARTR
jgi:hypothetical protein